MYKSTTLSVGTSLSRELLLQTVTVVDLSISLSICLSRKLPLKTFRPSWITNKNLWKCCFPASSSFSHKSYKSIDLF